LVDQNTPYNELEYSERLQINKQSEWFYHFFLIKFIER
jgi:hypothetical protein